VKHNGFLRKRAVEAVCSRRRETWRSPHDSIALNEHHTGDGAISYKHACALGCEGIVSKGLGSPYRARRVDCWLKVKNPAAPAVTREAEEMEYIRQQEMIRWLAGFKRSLSAQRTTICPNFARGTVPCSRVVLDEKYGEGVHRWRCDKAGDAIEASLKPRPACRDRRAGVTIQGGESTIC
jgi:hypothetical protein